MDKISVIIPAYQAESTIEDTIMSVYLNAKDAFIKYDLEIIVVDNNSKDKTKNIVKNLIEKYNGLYYFLEIKQGVSNARNRGINQSTGDYIMFLDADDKLDDFAIDKLYKAIKYNYVNQDGKPNEINKFEDYSLMLPIGRFKRIFANGKCRDSFKLTNPDIVKDFKTLFNETYIKSPCLKLYYKKRIDELNLRFDEDITIGEDQLFNFKYIFTRINNSNNNLEEDYIKRDVNIVMINDVIYKYIDIPTSITNTFDMGRITDISKVFKESVKILFEYFYEKNLKKISDINFEMENKKKLDIFMMLDVLVSEYAKGSFNILEKLINPKNRFHKQIIDKGLMMVISNFNKDLRIINDMLLKYDVKYEYNYTKKNRDLYYGILTMGLKFLKKSMIKGVVRLRILAKDFLRNK